MTLVSELLLDCGVSARLEIWRRAIAEMKHLGIEAKVEIGDAGIHVRACDGNKRIEHQLPVHVAEEEHHDPVLAHLMDAVDRILQSPALVLIEGGKARKG